MNKPHKHAELIKAWADGAKIEFFETVCHAWLDCTSNQPKWDEFTAYRIKLEPKPDYTDITAVYRNLNYRFENERLKNTYTLGFAPDYIGDLKLTWDGATGKLKSAEVL